MKKAILYFIVFIVTSLAVSFGAQGVLELIHGEGHELNSTELLVISAITSILLTALFTVLKWCPVSRAYVRTRPWGTFFWTVLLALGIILPLTWLEGFIPDEMKKDLTGEMLAKMLSSTEGYFVICMLAPLAEEIVFRGAIIRSIVAWGQKRRQKHVDAGNKQAETALSDRKIEWVAIVVSTLFFAIAHFNPAQIPHALIVGLLLGWLFVKTGSIVPGLILHWINNSTAYVIMNLFPNLPTDASLIELFNGNTAAMYQALGSSLFIALPALYQLIRLKRAA